MGLPFLVSQCAKLHVAGLTWAVSTRVHLESCTSLSPQSGNFWIRLRIITVSVINTLFSHLYVRRGMPVALNSLLKRRSCASASRRSQIGVLGVLPSGGPKDASRTVPSGPQIERGRTVRPHHCCYCFLVRRQ
jgi:hypothetical protein